MNGHNLLHTIFSRINLSKNEREKVIESFTSATFKKNEFIFKEGKILDHYFFIEKGFIRSFTFDFHDTEVTTNFYSESEIVIDWTSFMLRVPTQENFQANTDCVC